MRILLDSLDNGVTANFMPHFWMFLLHALTLAGHEVLLIDGNTQPMSDTEIVRFVLARGIGLVGIGAMTRIDREGLPGSRRHSRRWSAGSDGWTARHRGTRGSPGARGGPRRGDAMGAGGVRSQPLAAGGDERVDA
jgi:hypothetical protein